MPISALLEPRNLACLSLVSSYLHYTPIPKPQPPIARSDESGKVVRFSGRETKLYMGADNHTAMASNPSFASHRQISTSQLTSGPKTTRCPRPFGDPLVFAANCGIPMFARHRITNKLSGRTAKETCNRNLVNSETLLFPRPSTRLQPLGHSPPQGLHVSG